MTVKGLNRIVGAMGAALLFSGLVGWAQAGKAQMKVELVRYPDGYRDWTHVKSMVIQKGHPFYEAVGGIHHIYANPPALAALKAGKPYPNGAVFVFDLLEAPAEGGAIQEGPRKSVWVMQKHSRKFSHSAGWGWEIFKGDTRERVVKDAGASCVNCHESQKQVDYVFSQWRP